MRDILWRQGLEGLNGEQSEGQEREREKGKRKRGKKRGGGYICGIIEHRVLFSFNYNHVKDSK